MALSPQETSNLAHLLRRAGFGADAKEWQQAQTLGIAATTEKLLHPEKEKDILASVLSDIGGDYVDFNDINSVKQWWLYRMVHTNRPLEEKMTLFWHNHFATANYKVDNAPRMWAQNETFRRYGLGSFRTLLGQVARDPAMLVWLDGRDNRVGAPNENFGREVIELFTLGRGNGYTEKDVQEAARCFTGWRENNGDCVYDPTRHDDGEKTVLGETGNWHTDDVVDILARNPATARTLSTKLFKFFVHDSPSDVEIARLSKVYFDSQFEIRAVLRAIFTSTEFYSPRARFAKIKSPVEFAVATIRTLDAPLSAARDLGGNLNLMGQDLFYPPNVKGWSEGRDWVNSRTLLARVNFASSLADEMSRRVSFLERLQGMGNATKETMGNSAPAAGGAMAGGGAMSAPAMIGAPAMNAPAMNAPAMATPQMMAPAGGMMGKPEIGAMSAPTGGSRNSKTMPDASTAIQILWDALFRGMEMPETTRQMLLDYVTDKKPENADKIRNDKLPGLMNLMVSLPEYQLC